MARPATVTLTPIVEGDTWNGITVSWTSDGTAFADSLSAVTMEFRDQRDVLAETLTSGTSEITIDNPTTWDITVNPKILPMATGLWKWSITTTDSEGVIKTRIVGNLQIIDK